MNELNKFITELLQIPFIEENQAVVDGSFTVEPYMVDSLKGDGEVQNVSVLSTVNLFYWNRCDAVDNGILLFKKLCESNNFFCDNPDFTFENEAKFWRTTLRVQEVINNE